MQSCSLLLCWVPDFLQPNCHTVILGSNAQMSGGQAERENFRGLMLMTLVPESDDDDYGEEDVLDEKEAGGSAVRNKSVSQSQAGW